MQLADVTVTNWKIVKKDNMPSFVINMHCVDEKLDNGKHISHLFNLDLMHLLSRLVFSSWIFFARQRLIKYAQLFDLLLITTSQARTKGKP